MKKQLSMNLKDLEKLIAQHGKDVKIIDLINNKKEGIENE